MNHKKARINARKSSERGFNLIELLVAIVILGIVAAMAIPTWQRMQKNARLNGDGHNLAETLSVAKLRAGANFTESRLFFYTGSGTQYFRVDVWNPSVTSGAGTTACWVPDGKAVASLTGTDCVTNTSTTGYETNLSTGVTAGYSSLSTAPSNFVTTLAQSSSCMQGGTGPTTGGSAISSTSCIIFNSRGFPSASGGLYITDGTRVYGIVSNSMGLIKTYVSAASSANWTPY
jgi:prepilin-type N-terminal cleavage/methylation domain-containing protein